MLVPCRLHICIDGRKGWANFGNQNENINCSDAEKFGCNENNVFEDANPPGYNLVYINYVTEQILGSCQLVKFSIWSHQYSTVLDTGCEASILSEVIQQTEIEWGRVP
jgi:hypothetical protein